MALGRHKLTPPLSFERWIFYYYGYDHWPMVFGWWQPPPEGASATMS